MLLKNREWIITNLIDTPAPINTNNIILTNNRLIDLIG